MTQPDVREQGHEKDLQAGPLAPIPLDSLLAAAPPYQITLKDRGNLTTTLPVTCSPTTQHDALVFARGPQG